MLTRQIPTVLQYAELQRSLECLYYNSTNTFSEKKGGKYTQNGWLCPVDSWPANSYARYALIHTPQLSLDYGCFRPLWARLD